MHDVLLVSWRGRCLAHKSLEILSVPVVRRATPGYSLSRDPSPVPQPPSDTRERPRLALAGHISVIGSEDHKAVRSIVILSDPGLEAAEERTEELIVSDARGHRRQLGEIEHEQGVLER
jgi:hypothetical protein